MLSKGKVFSGVNETSDEEIVKADRGWGKTKWGRGSSRSMPSPGTWIDPKPRSEGTHNVGMSQIMETFLGGDFCSLSYPTTAGVRAL